jgi:hypothetical protein
MRDSPSLCHVPETQLGIRTIKPERKALRPTRDARLPFVQWSTIADDTGRFRAASRLLASLLRAIL